MPRTLIYLLIAALLPLAACDKTQEEEQSEKADQQQPAARPSGAKALPKEYRDAYKSELERAKTMMLELPLVDREPLEGDGTPALDEALEPFAEYNTRPLGEGFYDALRQGKPLSEEARGLVEKSADDLAKLREALRHTRYSPTLLLDDARSDQYSSMPAINASKLLAATGSMASPQVCMQMAADALRLARAESHGTGYLGGALMYALAGAGEAAARGCVDKLPAEQRPAAAERYAALLEHASPLADIVYFEWVSQLPKIGLIASGAIADPKLSEEQAREAIEFRLDRLAALRTFDSSAPYEQRVEKIKELMSPQEPTDNPLMSFGRVMFVKLLEKDQQLHASLAEVASELAAGADE